VPVARVDGDESGVEQMLLRGVARREVFLVEQLDLVEARLDEAREVDDGDL
jgi:hypothetical protein